MRAGSVASILAWTISEVLIVSPSILAGSPPPPFESPDTKSFVDIAQRASCPNGATAVSFTDSFTSLDIGRWTVELGASGVKTGSDGLTMTLSREMSGAGGIVIASKDSFTPPFTMSVQIQTTGNSGSVFPFIHKGDGQSGEEIDLEVTERDFQLPVWKTGQQRLSKNGAEAASGGQDLHQKLFNGVRENAVYKYSYPLFQPNQWTTYRLQWTRNTITWSIDGKKRVQYNRESDNFPEGPLPLRFGPWEAQSGSTWAGRTGSWDPAPAMKVRLLRVEGCRDMA